MTTAAGTQVAIEYENWLRIVTLVHYGGREVCLDILHQQEGAPFDGNQLYLLLQTKLPEFKKLLKNKKIKQNQYDLIFPANQITNTAEFDITLFTLVISVLYGNKYKLIIGDLRKWRNGEFHKGNISFTPLEFNTTWTDVATLLGNNGLNLSLVADLKTCVLDAQSVFRNAYLETLALRNSLDIVDSKQRIDDNKQRIDDNKQGIDDNKQRIDDSKQGIDDNKQGIDDNKQGIDDNKQRIDDSKQGIDDNKQGIDDNKQRIDDNKQRIDENKQRIDDNKQGIDDNKQRIDDNKQGVDDNKQGIDDNKQRIDDNKQGIDDSKQGIDDNKQRIDDNKQRINDNKQGVDDNKQGIDETKSSLLEVKGAQNQLKNIVDEITQDKKETDYQQKDFRFMVHETAPNFFGREELLDEIHEKFSLDIQYRYNAVVLTGLGGIGKSQTAAQYAFLHEKTFYDATIWLDVSDIEGSLCSLLDSLKVQYSQNKSVQVLTQLFCRKLHHQKCLIILDDASNKKSLNPILKNLNFEKNPSVLITSQNDKWKMSRIHQIRVDVFTQNEAEQFLLRELKEQPSEAIPELVDALQSFPLAMQQAVCYMKVNNMQIIKYLQYFKSNNKKLLDISIDDYGVTEYDKTLLTVWEIAFEKLQENELAVQVIGMMAYMDHRFINKNTFLQFDETDDEVTLNEVIEVLCEYSLLTTMQNKYLRMHFLVQKILKFRHQDRKDCFVLLKSLLMKLGDMSTGQFDTDEDNLWFPHVKKLFHERDEDLMEWVLKSDHFHDVTADRSDVSLLMSILHFTYQSNEKSYHSEISPAISGFPRLLSEKCCVLITQLETGKLEDCLNTISQFENKYLYELNNAKTSLQLWKMLVVNVLIESNQCDKAQQLYPSPPIERLYWTECFEKTQEYEKMQIYERMISNSHRLGRSEEALLLCQELMECRFLDPELKYSSTLYVAETFCFLGYYKKASLILQKLNDRNEIKIPENHKLVQINLRTNARINAGLGNYDIALSLIEKVQMSMLNTGQYMAQKVIEQLKIMIYIKTSEYSKSEFLLENQVSNYAYCYYSTFSLVVVKLFNRKFEDAVELLKSDLIDPYSDELPMLSTLYMKLYKNFEKKRSNGTIEKANEALSYVIALHKDLIEICVFPQQKEFNLFPYDF